MIMASRLVQRRIVCLFIEVEPIERRRLTFRQIQLEAVSDQGTASIALAQLDKERQSRPGFQVEVCMGGSLVAMWTHCDGRHLTAGCRPKDAVYVVWLPKVGILLQQIGSDVRDQLAGRRQRVRLKRLFGRSVQSLRSGGRRGGHLRRDPRDQKVGATPRNEARSEARPILPD